MPSESNVQESLPELEWLADLLLKKGDNANTIVVPFIGAGASASAGLPTSSQLTHRIYSELVKDSLPSDPIRELFDIEARALFPRKASAGILRLSLFEFTAVVSQLAYGREVVQTVLHSVLAQATHRPLAYELLAHLAKHKFVDHFVSLNFDLLLDQALQDELPDELHIISSPDDVPGRRATQQSPESTCYFVKPFGSLAMDRYRLRSNELTKYGPDPVWKFITRHIFSRPTGDRTPDVTLLLIGYAAAEQAFSHLIDELTENAERNISIVAIDPIEKLSPILSQLGARHIRLKADLALTLLLEIMRQLHFLQSTAKVWIPVARHHLISRFLTYRQLQNAGLRFKIELILQAVKSRGFFTFEALGEVERIQRYSSEAHQGISDLRHEKILELQQWDESATASARADFLMEDYTLALPDYDKLADKVIGLLNSKPDEQMEKWRINYDDDNFTAVREKTTRAKFMAEQFDEIASAPEIEISSHGWPYARWLFSRPRRLTSIEELAENTNNIFRTFLQGGDQKIEIFGIWVTGEWLFHPEGWAYSLGREILNLMSEGKAEVSMILVRIPVSDSIRRERAETAREALRKARSPGTLKIYEMDWRRHNRRLTLIRYKDSPLPPAEGIYMRRRHATPLVSPVSLSGSKDCNVLERIFERYKDKAEEVEG